MIHNLIYLQKKYSHLRDEMFDLQENAQQLGDSDNWDEYYSSCDKLDNVQKDIERLLIKLGTRYIKNICELDVVTEEEVEVLNEIINSYGQ